MGQNNGTSAKSQIERQQKNRRTKSPNNEFDNGFMGNNKKNHNK